MLNTVNYIGYPQYRVMRAYLKVAGVHYSKPVKRQEVEHDFTFHFWSDELERFAVPKEIHEKAIW